MVERLSVGAIGSEVAQLHENLRRHGFQVPSSEVRRAFFGPGTREALIACQEAFSLPRHGELDESTATALSAGLPTTASTTGTLNSMQLGALTPGNASNTAPESRRAELESPAQMQGRRLGDDGHTVGASQEEAISDSMQVYGQVRRADGTQVRGATVRAYDRSFRVEELLGQANSDAGGSYCIPYTVAQLRPSGKTAADLIVRAFGASDRPIGESALIFRAQPVESVDLMVEAEDAGDSEYDEMAAAVISVTGGVSVAQLTDDDIHFLAGKTGIEARHIGFLAEAARSEEATGLPAAAAYGMLRRKLPIDPPALSQQPLALVREALASAARDRIVPGSVGDDLDAIMRRLADLRTEHARDRGARAMRAPLAALLDTVPGPPAYKAAAVARLAEHDGSAEDILQQLRESPAIDREIVGGLQFALGAEALTGGNLRLVRALQQLRSQGELSSVRDLARLDAQEWLDLAGKRVDGTKVGFPPKTPDGTDAEKARHMVAAAEAAFPTAAIAYRLRRDSAEDAPFSPEEAGQLSDFLLDHPDFEFGTALVDTYHWGGDAAGLRDKLKRLQRMFHLAPRYTQLRALLADGLDSAQSIVRTGRAAFVRSYGDALGSPIAAERVYDRARQARAMALALFGTYNRAVNAIGLPVLAAPVEALRIDDPSLASTVPTLEVLFGSLDLCDCEDCQSVYSPAAYLADILQFVARRPATTQGRRALEVLLDPHRRADLGRIALSCPNTNTPVPYVDLVNEVLEDAVAAPPLPIGHWKFDDGAGATAVDSSIGGNEGALLGRPSGRPSPTWVTGRAGSSCLNFTGDGEHVRIGSSTTLALSGTGSISIWIHPKGLDTLSPRGTILAREGEFVLSWTLASDQGLIDWRFNNRRPAEIWHAAGGPVAPVDRWTHLAVVFDRGAVRTYANGELVDDAPGSGTIGTGGEPNPIIVGGRPGIGDFFMGLIDDVRLYNRALTAREVRDLVADRPDRQTRGTADEIAANPEHTNPAAYAVLAAAPFPWTLPYQRWVEDARSYLDHMGVARHEILAAFRRKGARTGSTAMAVVAEHLGMTTADRKIILGGSQNPPQPWRYWGLPPSAIADPAKNLALAANGAVATASSTFSEAYPPSSVINGDRTAHNWGVGERGGGGWQDATDGAYPDWIQVEFAGPREVAEINVITLADEDQFVGGGVDPSPDMTFSDRGITDFEIQYWDDTRWVTVPGGAISGNELVWRRFAFPSVRTRRIRVLIHAALDRYSRIVQVEAYAPVTGGWVRPLRRVDEFMRRTGLSYNDVADLLATRFINPARVVALHRGGDGCRLDDVTIANLDEPTAVRVMRFVRLWRRLGWTMWELDQTISAVDPRGPAGERQLTADFLRQVSHVKRLRQELNTPLPTVLTWWAAIDTMDAGRPGGPTVPSLYRQVFLNKSVANPPNPAFEPATLERGIGKISDVMPWIAAALEMSVDDLAVLTSTDLTDDALTLGNLSYLYRVATFAKSLRLPVRDFLSLRDLTGIHPVRPLAVAGPVRTHETLDTLRFVELLRDIRAAGLTVGQLGYLLRHDEEGVRAAGLPAEQMARLLRELSDGLRRIAEENAVSSDPTGELLRERLEIAAPLIGWSDNDINQTWSMIDGTVTYATELDPIPAIALPDALRTKVTHEGGRLHFTGVMTAAERAELVALSGDAAYLAAVAALFKAPRAFVTERMAAFVEPAEAIARLLDDGSLSPSEKFAEVLRTLAAKVNRILGENLVKQKLGEALRLDPALVQELLTERLTSPSGSGLPLVDDFLDQAGGGVSATYYENEDLTGATVRRIDQSIAFDWGHDPPVPSVGWASFSVRWSGTLRVDRTETYTFHARVNGGVILRVNNQVLIDRWNHDSLAEPEAKITLQAGRVYDVELQYRYNSGGAVAQLSWSSQSSSKSILPTNHLLPATAIAALTLLHKAALMVNAIPLTVPELTYLSTHQDDFAGFDVNLLPLRYGEATGHPLDRLRPLLDLAALKKRLPYGKSNLLVEVFGTATETAAGKPATQSPALSVAVVEQLSAATGWRPNEIVALADVLHFADHDFTRPDALVRLHRCMELSGRLGVPPDRLAAWALREPDETQAHEIRDAVKATYGHGQWLTAIKPVADASREQRRRALVDYLLYDPTETTPHFANADELFAHFLIDVEMSPCQLTSRIKQAISSVQLFVLRCQMNLEPEVALTPVDDAEWEWTKSYRIWEANRKVFLYPENWVAPELRDDKTPFFKDLEKELLQTDITAESAKTAYLNYLEKLDAVSHLEPCGMYHQIDRDARHEPSTDILHVFGCTVTDPRVYYYRRLQDSVWSAWEKVPVDISGNHLVPVVHQGRLYAFWPIFMEKATEQTQQQLQGSPTPPTKHWQIQLAWTEYKDGRWLTKQAAPNLLSNDQLLRSGQRVLGTVSTSDPLSRDDLSRLYSWSESRSVGDGADGLYVRWYRSYDWTAYGKEIGTFRALIGERTLQPIVRTTEDYPFRFWARPQNMMLTGYGPFTLRDIDTPPPPADPVILSTASDDKFRIMYPHQFYDAEYLSSRLDRVDESGERSTVTPFFYLDGTRTFFLTQRERSVLGASVFHYRFETFYHPFADHFIRELNRNGIDGLLRQETQLASNNFFEDRYSPQGVVEAPHPVEDVDFSERGAFSKYNWELFFHAPLLIASRLSTNQRFEEAQQWFHYVFNPTAGARRGLSATYYKNPDLTGATVTRVDRTIDFDWRSGSPDPAITSDGFSVEWTGQVQPEFSETYTFSTHTDDGVRLWVNGTLLIDQWHDQSPTTYSGGIDLEAGRLYSIKMQYYERSGGARAQLSWSSWSTPWSIIPNARLYPDPAVTPDSPARFWGVRPFFEEASGKPIQDLMRLLATPDAQLTGPLLAQKRELELHVRRWREKPFSPHLIARLRRTAYQKAVVMAYLDNLIAWGDQLFRRDTMESINEATQIYILAAAILGPRPDGLPAQQRTARSYNELRGRFDAFSNALVPLENLAFQLNNGEPLSNADPDPQPLDTLTLYFGIPRNDKLLGYWSLVEDRLFKVRHCQNIEGVERQLPLFEPPIDPALLVRAAAAGAGIGTLLNDASAPLPRYRFAVMAQKAGELCADLKSLGGALLSALERYDAEALALLRSTQEVQILNAVREVKERQVTEAERALEALRLSRQVVNFRRSHYATLKYKTPREQEHVARLEAAHRWQTLAQGLEMMASNISQIPDFDLGTEGMSSPVVKATFGGSNLANMLQLYARNLNTLAAVETHRANLAGIVSGWDRRAEEWKFQENAAARELQQIDQQILGGEIRLAIAQKEIKNHDLQVANASKADEYLRSKFTNQELFEWMSGQISTIYFQGYQLAYDVAKRAERAYRFELGLADSSFIRFGYWDSLRKGLLAGERLHQDIRRMEVAYLEQNRRDYELTKHISLALLDPAALIQLRETGKCQVDLHEVIFDLDNPGQYLRRIKSVGVSIPCVVGPYTGVNCTLTLVSSSVRTNAGSEGADDYPRSGAADPRFTDIAGSMQSIVTSTGREDHGVFDPNLRDERYQPFEGAGVISSWQVELDGDRNPSLLDTVTDVVLHMRFTARDGGARLKGDVKDWLAGLPRTGVRLWSAKRELPMEWRRFQKPADSAEQQEIAIPIAENRFPATSRGARIHVDGLQLVLKLTDNGLNKHFAGAGLSVYAKAPDSTEVPGMLKSVPTVLDGVPCTPAPVTVRGPVGQKEQSWIVGVTSEAVAALHKDVRQTVKVGDKVYHHLAPTVLDDVFVLCHFSIQR